MTKYEVSTPDGVLHRIDAVTHTRDTNGLTLLVDGGKAVAMFPVFNWMRVAAAETEAGAAPKESAESGEVGTTSPAAEGE
ncbi:hypothetical protein ACIKP7_01370 [Pseudomonas caricapapayae]|uniref:Uncharacterized protein n=1 Tax=Pseudomonas caricapapayae TaxID=46678 RepID=A0ACC7LTW3_9PSED